MDLADIHCYNDNSSYSIFFSSAKTKKWTSVESESQGLEEPIGGDGIVKKVLLPKLEKF